MRTHRSGRPQWWVITALVFALFAMFAPELPAAAASSTASAGTFPVVTFTQLTSAAGFTHPGIAVSAPSLMLARQEVTAGVQPWSSYYQAMFATKYASATLTPVNHGSGVDTPGTTAFNSQGVESQFIEDAFGAYTQAIEYFITGNPAYRENGMHIIRTWSHIDPSKVAPYPDAHIHAGIPLMRMLAAAEIFRYSSVNPTADGYDTTWTAADTTNLTTNLITPVSHVLLDGNTYFMSQQSYPLVGEIAADIFTDDQADYAKHVEWFSVNSTNPDTDTNGSLIDLIREIPADDPGNHYGYAFVQEQEMGRDQAHAWDGINALTEIARLLAVQNTKLDPVTGTVSSKPDAVSPYVFGNDRLLAGTDAYYAYMMGKTIPWIDTTGGPGAVAEAYRGRVFDPIDELYNIYTYDFVVDVARQAPDVAAIHAQNDGPELYWGTQAYNFWNSNPDYNPDYWLSLPAQVAGQTRPAQPASPLVQVAHRSIALDNDSRIRQDSGHDVVELRASQRGSTIAVRTLMLDSTTGYSPVGVLIRTNGPATLEIRKNLALSPYQTVSLPDTHGQWRYVTYDMDSSVVVGSTGGQYLAYYTIVGQPKVTVDIDSVNLQAKAQLSPPVFAQGAQTTVIGVAGETLTRSLAATSPAGKPLTYEAAGLPRTATVDTTTAALSWTPDRAGSARPGGQTATVTTSDGTTDTVLNVRFVGAPDRPSGLTAAEAGFDPKAVYVSTTLAAYNAAVAAVRARMDTADDATFLAGLVTVQQAVAGLRLLNPTLADGSLDYPPLVTSSLSPTAVWNMVDNDINSYSGDLTAPFTLDFGAGFRVRADAFGLQARYNFANRSQGANVYGSDDGVNWTLLTSRETSNTTPNFQLETIPVLDSVRTEPFRFFKVQVDDPGVPTDPNYPGLSSFSEFRIHGVRLETAQAISSATLSSTDPVAGRAVNGDTVTLALTATQPISDVAVRIEGIAAALTSTGNEHYTASVVLPENVDFGRALRFSADYTTATGQAGTTVFQTTDGSALQLWNTHVLVDHIDQSWVNASSPQFPGTGTTQANGWRMFDGNLTTYTDTTSSTGWVTVEPTDGSTLPVDAVLVYPRTGFPNRANGTVIQSSTDGGQTWQTFATVSGVTADQQWYTYRLPSTLTVPMLRVYDGHGGFTNLADVELVHLDSTAAR